MHGECYHMVCSHCIKVHVRVCLLHVSVHGHCEQGGHMCKVVDAKLKALGMDINNMYSNMCMHSVRVHIHFPKMQNHT